MSRPRTGKSPANQPGSANLASLLSQYMACPAQSKPPSFFSFVREQNPHVFSHHDHALSDYRDHVLKCSGLFICRGCTVVLITTVASFAAGMVSHWPVLLPTLTTALCFVVLLVLSLIPLRDSPRTVLHDLRRAALGVLLGSAAAYLILCDDWILRGVVIGVYLIVLAARRMLKSRATGRNSR